MNVQTVDAVDILTKLCPVPDSRVPIESAESSQVQMAKVLVVLTSAIGHLVASSKPTHDEAMRTIKALDMIVRIAQLLEHRGFAPMPEKSSVELLIGMDYES